MSGTVPGIENVPFNVFPYGRSEELVFVALAQDKATYQALAAMPEQDAWFRRVAEHVEGEVRWEDVAMEMVPS